MAEATTDVKSPFYPGARVAIGTHYGLREAKIGKVHKSGRFTLEGSSQQWTPQGGVAFKSGRHGFGLEDTVHAWDAGVAERVAATAHGAFVRNASRKLDRIEAKQITPEFVEALQRAMKLLDDNSAE